MYSDLLIVLYSDIAGKMKKAKEASAHPPLLQRRRDIKLDILILGGSAGFPDTRRIRRDVFGAPHSLSLTCMRRMRHVWRKEYLALPMYIPTWQARTIVSVTRPRSLRNGTSCAVNS